MISYLKGQAVTTLHRSTNRIILILEVNDIGYEIQITQRLLKEIKLGQSVQIFTHYQLREDQAILYGFTSAPERDLFRQLISVAGIGAQSAIALIDSLGLEQLIQAIITGNTQNLTKTPGIGAKTAARIALELKTKLKEWRQSMQSGDFTSTTPLDILEDLEITLLALGYTANEIEQTIFKISQDEQLKENSSVDDWLKSAIASLSHS
ncbi:Holliday junction branch migration protein RuvA [Gloeocapsa sp. PCC 73106]|uniref:Holliday junction branch migration protein RuvA n=1 Tax=Gloeocapsa sp. PCC 73106 TaxID=102232 RepID=UPI0002ACDFCB|nr:Holliday junction branch migration protein RuvA [Gloeocapsa sp. PCC 73106]ELR97810.1 Holliday junction DNA helicase subunit RuvA [Gloeocapsa sp. PCC 73106]